MHYRIGKWSGGLGTIVWRIGPQLGEISGSGEGIDCLGSGRSASTPSFDENPHIGLHGSQ